MNRVFQALIAATALLTTGLSAQLYSRSNAMVCEFHSVIRRVRRWAVAALAVACLGVSGLEAQQPLVYKGAIVRVTWTEPADWIVGTVDMATTREFIITPLDGETPTQIRPDESIRVQLQHGRRPGPILGAGLGATVAAVIGGALLSDKFRGITMGIIGAGVGAVIGSQFGGDRWIDVPVEGDHLALPPLSSPAADVGRASLNSAQWWRRFEPSDGSFTAFFEEHREQLRLIEGVYHVRDSDRRRVIVRDGRYSGYEYVLVAVPRGQAVGRVLAAIRPTGRFGAFELRYTRRLVSQPVPVWLSGQDLFITRRDESPLRLNRVFP